MGPNAKYAPVSPGDDDKQSVGSNHGRDNMTQDDMESGPRSRLISEHLIWQLPRMMKWLAWVDAALLLLAFASLSIVWLRTKPLSKHDLIMATNSYSPYLSRVKAEFEEQRLQTARVNDHNDGGPSLFREPPSPAVDEAWRSLHKDDNLFAVTEDEVRRLGKNPEVVVKAPSEWGYDGDYYVALNQGQHDVHCLNNMRMFVYAEHYYGNRTEHTEIHALHCLHAVMQTLQCKFSTDVYTAMWVQGSAIPMVNFDIMRKCQKYEDVSQTGPKQPYSQEQFGALRAPPGQKRIPANIY